MKLISMKIFICPIAVLLLHSTLSAIEPKIKLTVRKDLVLSTESRQTVLEVGHKYLTSKEGESNLALADLENPFAFKSDEPEQVVVTETGEVKAPPVEEKIVYDDAAVLAASAANFASKVKGSISRGDKVFIQLAGGSMLKPGASFPIRLPQAPDQTFTLTVTKITSQGYTLQVGDATQEFTYGNSQSNSGSIKFSNQ